MGDASITAFGCQIPGRAAREMSYGCRAARERGKPHEHLTNPEKTLSMVKPDPIFDLYGNTEFEP